MSSIQNYIAQHNEMRDDGSQNYENTMRLHKVYPKYRGQPLMVHDYRIASQEGTCV